MKKPNPLSPALRPKQCLSTFAARGPVVVMRRNAISASKGGHFRDSRPCCHVEPFSKTFRSDTERRDCDVAEVPGTHRYLRLNKKSGRICPARSTEGQMSKFIEIGVEVKRAFPGFVRAVGRAVAPAVGPRVASISARSGPIPHRSADRVDCALPTYLRHLGERA